MHVASGLQLCNVYQFTHINCLSTSLLSDFSTMSTFGKPPTTKPTLKTGSSKSLTGSKPATKPRKPKSLPTLVAVKPLNLEVEKKKFFDSGGKYNPQFLYSADVDSKIMLQYGKPSSQYLAQVSAVRFFATFCSSAIKCSGPPMLNIGRWFVFLYHSFSQ